MIPSILWCVLSTFPVDPNDYMRPVIDELQKEWPRNRAVNIVFHGHSVPAGYFATPHMSTFNAYPQLTHEALASRFPTAVINVIVTAIGGENSVQGAKRFDSDVLTHHPGVIGIDYGLNDRGVPMSESRDAWISMIHSAKAHHVKVLLFTPTPDLSAKMLDPTDALTRQAVQIREIASSEGVGLVDSYAQFTALLRAGTPLGSYMAQSNHPNRKGHEEVAQLVLKWFPNSKAIPNR